jgi:hypothetical protein
MNANISQQIKTLDWNSGDRLLEQPVKYFNPAILKVKINKPMTKLSWKDIEDSIEHLLTRLRRVVFYPTILQA